MSSFISSEASVEFWVTGFGMAEAEAWSSLKNYVVSLRIRNIFILVILLYPSIFLAFLWWKQTNKLLNFPVPSVRRCEPKVIHVCLILPFILLHYCVYTASSFFLFSSSCIFMHLLFIWHLSASEIILRSIIWLVNEQLKRIRKDPI